MTKVSYRETKYCNAVRDCIAHLGHATNSMIIDQLRAEYPKVSATTIHRVTARLYERGEVSLAPPDKNGAIRYDSNTQPHDHFICQVCNGVRDIDIYNDIKPNIESSLGMALSDARITIAASCNRCAEAPK